MHQIRGIVIAEVVFVIVAHENLPNDVEVLVLVYQYALPFSSQVVLLLHFHPMNLFSFSSWLS